MLFHFHLSALARQLTAAMQRTDKPKPRSSDVEERMRADREIAQLEAAYALPAFGTQESPFRGLFRLYPGRLFTMMSIIFFTTVLTGA